MSRLAVFLCLCLCASTALAQSRQVIMMVGGAPSTNLVQFASPLADDQSVPECLADPTPYPAEFVYGTAGAFLQSVGKPMFCGGNDEQAGYLDVCRTYDFSTKQWEDVSTMVHPHVFSGHDYDDVWGFVLAGGRGADETPQANVEYTQTAEGPFTVLAQLPAEWARHCTVIVDEDRLFAAYENTALVYSRTADTWTEVTAMPNKRVLHNCATVTNDAGEVEVLVIGGFDAPFPVDTVDVYNVDRDEWSVGPALPFPNMEATLAQRGDLIVITGGFNLESGLLDTLIKFNTDDRSWTVLDQTMDVGLEHHAALIVDVDC